jgi:hypothetical protein
MTYNKNIRPSVGPPPPDPQGDRKGPIHSSTPLPPLQRYVPVDTPYVVFVRAGAGTLAVALGGIMTLQHLGSAEDAVL